MRAHFQRDHWDRGRWERWGKWHAHVLGRLENQQRGILSACYNPGCAGPGAALRLPLEGYGSIWYSFPQPPVANVVRWRLFGTDTLESFSVAGYRMSIPGNLPGPGALEMLGRLFRATGGKGTTKRDG